MQKKAKNFELLMNVFIKKSSFKAIKSTFFIRFIIALM